MTKQDKAAFFVTQVALENNPCIRLSLDADGDYIFEDRDSEQSIFINGNALPAFIRALAFLSSQ